MRVGPRAFAWGLVFAGLGLSMNAEEPKARPLPQRAGYTILVALVRDDCRRDAAAPPVGDTWLDHVSTWAVWLGMCALVVMGADEIALEHSTLAARR